MNERIEVGGKHAGYQVYVDSFPHLWVDVLENWTDIDKQFPKDSVSKLFASHVIEHLTWPNQIKALTATFNILKPGGEIELDTPDVEALARLMVDGKISPAEFQNTTFGDQDYDLNSHRFCHTPKSLFKMFGLCGFFCKSIQPASGGLKGIGIKPEVGYSLKFENNIYVYRAA